MEWHVSKMDVVAFEPAAGTSKDENLQEFDWQGVAASLPSNGFQKKERSRSCRERDRSGLREQLLGLTQLTMDTDFERMMSLKIFVKRSW